jgi:hypothetical protein
MDLKRPGFFRTIFCYGFHTFPTSKFLNIADGAQLGQLSAWEERFFEKMQKRQN